MRSLICLNPVNAMVLSKNDGMFNNDVNLPTEALITLNSFHRTATPYSEAELKEIDFICSLKPEDEIDE